LEVLSAVSWMSGLLQPGLFFAMHRDPEMNMIALLSLVSGKIKAIVEQTAKISDETLEYMTKPYNLHLSSHFRREFNLVSMVMQH
jgi:hypothetical protein